MITCIHIASNSIPLMYIYRVTVYNAHGTAYIIPYYIQDTSTILYYILHTIYILYNIFYT